MVGRPARRPDRTTAVNSGRRRRRACAGSTSGGELLTTLAPAAGEDRAARAGAHPQPEAVGLRPAAVVRLEGALAHGVLLQRDVVGAGRPVGRRGGGGGGGARAAVRAPRAPPAGAARGRAAADRRAAGPRPPEADLRARRPATGRVHGLR